MKFINLEYNDKSLLSPNTNIKKQYGFNVNFTSIYYDDYFQTLRTFERIM